MHKIVRKSLKYLLKIVSDFLIKTGALGQMILIKVDGGICSQMHFYLIGKLYEEKGFHVKYDLSWFKKSGVDLTGKFARNFDLIKAFPYLKFSTCSSFEKFMYRVYAKHNNYYDNSAPLKFLEITPPTYLTGYFQDPPGLYDELYRRCFYFRPEVLNHDSLLVYNKIKESTTPVAVHVRRGDLSLFNSAYGDPVSTEYFKNAINYVYGRCSDASFFFFSDEPQWVEEQLLPKLHKNIIYDIVSVNGSDCGYMDLFLIAACTHQITSKGSLGKYGALLNNDPSRMILLYDDHFERSKWEGVSSNIIFIKG